MCKKYSLAASLVFCAFVSAILPQVAFGQTGNSLCGPVVNATLSVSYECLNDTIMLRTSSGSGASGWHYATDSALDGVGQQNVGGTAYEIYGLSFLETNNQVVIAICGNNPIDGTTVSGAANGTVGHGDIFINFTSDDFLTASNNSALYGVRYASKNESGAPQLGVYKNVSTKTVADINIGFLSLKAYEDTVKDRKGVIGYGDLPADQTYYANNINLNVIEQGTYLGPITALNASELTALGFNAAISCSAAAHITAFRFQKNLIIDECGVFGGNGESCRDCRGVACGNTDVDQCGVCGGDGRSCLDCDGIPYGTAKLDQCGVCGGDSKSCLDCSGALNGTATLDQCGVCNGDGKSCLDCNGVPNGGATLDTCGICGGNNTSCLDCAGVANGTAKENICGLCSGKLPSCATDASARSAQDQDGDGIENSIEGTEDADKDGKPNFLDVDSDGDGLSDCIEAGNKSGGSPIDTDGDGLSDYLDADSDNDTFSDYAEAFDANGDGTIDRLPSGKDDDGDGIDNAFDVVLENSDLNCAWREKFCPDGCVPLDISKEIKSAKDAVKVIVDRGQGFATSGNRCLARTKGKKKPAFISTATLESRYQAIISSVEQNFKPLQFSCQTGLCTSVSTADITSGLKAQIQSLHAETERIQSAYEKACKIKKKKPKKGKKSSSEKGRDSIRGALGSVNALPGSVTNCN